MVAFVCHPDPGTKDPKHCQIPKTLSLIGKQLCISFITDHYIGSLTTARNKTLHSAWMVPCSTTKSFLGSTLVQYPSGYDRYHRKLNSGVPYPKLIIPKISVSHNRTSVPITQKRQIIWFSLDSAELPILLEQQA